MPQPTHKIYEVSRSLEPAKPCPAPWHLVKSRGLGEEIQYACYITSYILEFHYIVEWISHMPLDLFPYQHGPRNINSCVRLRRDGVAEALHRLLEAEEQAAPTKESERRTMSIFMVACAHLHALFPAGKWFKLVTVTQKIVWSFEIVEVELVSNVCRALRIAGSSHICEFGGVRSHGVFQSPKRLWWVSDWEKMFLSHWSRFMVQLVVA